MIYIYIDESGDLGFDFENKNPSKYFTLTLVVVKNIESNKALKKEVETTLKRKINTKKKNKRVSHEIKGSKTTIEIKKYLFSRIQGLDFDIYSITFQKKNVKSDLQKNKSRLYNYFVRQLIDQIDLSFVEDKLTIVLDKSKNKEQIKDCNDYLIRNIEAKVSLDIEIDILHENSESMKQLQVADVFCYGFFEKYNKSCDLWCSVFQKKVCYDEVWFEDTR